MIILHDYICTNCKYQTEDIFKGTAEEFEDHALKCPKCGFAMKVDLQNKPKHQRHVSWTTWRVG